MGDFSVEIEHLDGTVLVRPSGELDLATAPELERVLDHLIDEDQVVVVDFSEVTFADCAGLRPIRWALQQRHPVRLRTSPAHPLVERVLEMTGLGRPTAVA
jgi:stage II sporulation protein AA (anti-sigma F factor antagonist)